jgi:hypothetical protein
MPLNSRDREILDHLLKENSKKNRKKLGAIFSIISLCYSSAIN